MVRSPKACYQRRSGANTRLQPLSDIFSATPKGAPNPFTQQLLNKAQTPKVKVAQTEDTLSPGARPGVQEHPQPSPKVPTSKFHVPVGDSGYFGSQSADTVVPEARAVAAETVNASSPRRSTVVRQNAPPAAAASSNEDVRSPTQRLTDSFHSAKEQQTTKVVGEETTKVLTRPPMSPRQPSPTRAPQPSSPIPVRSSPLKTAPVRSSPFKAPTEDPAPASPLPAAVDALEPAEKLDEEVRSPSDGSSPIRRPLVRKSSLSFAPLPARERLTTTKSMGAQASLNRPSYYPRITGGKSLGNVRLDAAVDDDMDLDHGPAPVATKAAPAPESDITKHNKTYTQRLQDQINLLGQSQANAARVAKPMGSAAAGSQSLAASQPKPSQEVRPMSPGRKPVAKPAPGTFPDDEEDEWIAPPGQNRTVKAASPRPPTGKAYSTDVVDGLHSKEAAGGADFQPPKQRQVDVRPPSPQKLPFVPERATSVLGHAKSASVPHLPGLGIEIGDDGLFGHKKTISVSNPTLATVNEDSRPGTPSKSPSRSYKDSPLKQVKNKLSSILKTSKGLLASSAALSAEGKSSILSPSTTRLALHLAPSMDSVYQQTAFASQDALYPDLSKHANPETQTLTTVSSPSRPVSQRTRSSTDKEEKREEKRREKEQKEARRLAEMADKLEKAREKEREKARVFSKEQQEKMEKQLAAAAAREQEMMEKQLVAAAAKEQERIEKQRAAAAAAAAAKEQERIEKQRAAAAAKEQERMMKQQQAAVAAKEHEKADEPLQPSSPSRPARTSPRKAKAQAEEEARAQAPPIAEADEPDGDVEMADALPVIGPSAPTPGPAAKTRQLRRPVKPAKEIPVKAKQAPTLIRINTGSQQSQFHPSNSLLSATLQNAVTPGGPSQPRLTSKASSQSLQTKPSIQSLKSSTTTTASGRSKALEMATKKKEQVG